MPISNSDYSKIRDEEKYLLLDGVHQALLKKFHSQMMEVAGQAVDKCDKDGRDPSDIVLVLICRDDMEESVRDKYTTDYVASCHYRQEFYNNGPWKDRQHPYHSLMLDILDHPGDMTIWGVVIAGLACTVRKIHFGENVELKISPHR